MDRTRVSLAPLSLKKQNKKQKSRCKDYCGEGCAMGSTTGSLFISTSKDKTSLRLRRLCLLLYRLPNDREPYKSPKPPAQPYTSSPTLYSVTPSPTASMVPAKSIPKTPGNYGANGKSAPDFRIIMSIVTTLLAATRTTTCPVFTARSEM